MNTADESADFLRSAFPPGSTARTILRHVSASGMTRWISVIAPGEDGPADVSWHVARVLGTPVNHGRHEGIKREGAGMDMGFDLVYSLSRALYPDGFDCLQYTPEGDDLAADGDRSRRCPSSDHVNRPYPRTFMHHGDGGYAISHRWL